VTANRENGPPDEAAHQRRLVEMLIREQQLLGFEIHDGIVQEMTAALMFLESTAAEIEPAVGKVPGSLNQAMSLIRHAVGEARQLIAGLQPVTFEPGGLAPALSELVAEFRQRSVMEIRLEIDPFERLAAPIEHALYRIVRECLHNATKHSQATQVFIELKQSPAEIRLSFRDNGHGFNPAQVKSNHYGLVSIRERAGMLGGKATIDAAPGKGCSVIVALPRHLPAT
jgi:signal transduction histidine kinase